MKKILVHVGVPVISGSYDILMPEDLPVVEMNLNRPFAFAITGADGLPLFVGAVNTME